MSAGWEVIGEDVLLDTPHLRVTRETVRTPANPAGREWTKVTRRVGVTVAPRLADGAFILIREERVPARREFWQFPAGQVEQEPTRHAVEQAARRELLEEAGCTVTGCLEYLGKFFTSPGFTDEHAHQFLATEVRWDRAAAVHDGEEEILEVKAFSAEDLREMITHGVIEDANTLALYARLAAGRWL
ncbi:MAG: NUDIX hydrolase [Chthoniobacterales bacterium]|nr:NUDIX hydrolase [Chthoniobacterales bacterium]